MVVVAAAVTPASVVAAVLGCLVDRTILLRTRPERGAAFFLFAAFTGLEDDGANLAVAVAEF